MYARSNSQWLSRGSINDELVSSKVAQLVLPLFVNSLGLASVVACHHVRTSEVLN